MSAQQGIGKFVIPLLKRLGILAADGTYSGGLSGLGSVDNAVVRTDGTGGDRVQGSSVTVDDDGNTSLPSAGQLKWSTDVGLKRAAAGVVQVTDGSTGSGAILSAAGSASANGVQVGAANTGLYSANNGTRLYLTANGGNYVGANSRGSGEIDFMGRPGIGLHLYVFARTSDGSEVGSTGFNTSSTYALQTNRGAAGTVTRTLPATPAVGARFRFMRVESQAFRVAVGNVAHQIMRADGTLTTAGHYLELASDGAFLEVVWDGTVWLALAERGTVNEES